MNNIFSLNIRKLANTVLVITFFSLLSSCSISNTKEINITSEGGIKRDASSTGNINKEEAKNNNIASSFSGITSDEIETNTGKEADGNTGSMVVNETVGGSGGSNTVQSESQEQNATGTTEKIHPMIIADSEYVKISQIQTLRELEIRYPNIQNMNGKEHPKFFEFAKKQLMLESFIKNYDNQTFLGLKERYTNLQSAREIWPPELIKIEKRNRLTGLDLKDDPSNNTLLVDMQDISTHREILFNELFSSKEYAIYEATHKDEMNETERKMIELLPPYIIELQKEVEILRAEVSPSGN